MDDAETMRWRRDGSTSRTIRLCWSLGVGTFLAMILLVPLWRIYDLARVLGGLSIPVPGVGTVSISLTAFVLAVVGAVAVTLLALALNGETASLLEALPGVEATEDAARRTRAAIVGTVTMGTVIGSLLVLGRLATEAGGPSEPFTGLAAATLPLAFVAILLSSFLRSVGALDLEEGRLYLYEPEEAVDLSVIEGASVRRIGDAAILTLAYAQPDGQYVPGPRRLVVPPAVARTVQELVG